jgi:hypothetical protein
LESKSKVAGREAPPARRVQAGIHIGGLPLLRFRGGQASRE